jgi:NAD(P)H-hydrate epimerase
MVGIDQLETLQNTAERIKKAIILKGIRPLMGFPDGSVYINLCGPVNVDEEIIWDSLGTTISVMLNLGFPIQQAIRQGVFIHFLARDIAVEKHRGSQLTNRDFLNDLPRIVKMLQKDLDTELINRYTGIQIV